MYFPSKKINFNNYLDVFVHTSINCILTLEVGFFIPIKISYGLKRSNE